MHIYLYCLLHFGVFLVPDRVHSFARFAVGLLYRLLDLCFGSLFLFQLRVGGLWRVFLVPVTRCLFRCDSELVLVTCLLRVTLDLVDLGLKGLE